MDARSSLRRITLQQALSQHSYFTEKEKWELTPLTQQGHCNQNHLLYSGTERYILREFGKEDRDRAQEYHIQRLAYHKGIAAQPLLLDLENGFMITTYIAGIHKKQLNTKALSILADTLHSLHSINSDIPLIILDKTTTDLSMFTEDPVLCHNDLNPYNLIWHDTLTLIDWEYAGMNDRYFDLASIVVEFGLNKAETSVFLDHYFRGEPWSEQKLHAYSQIYKEICADWWKKR